MKRRIPRHLRWSLPAAVAILAAAALLAWSFLVPAPVLDRRVPGMDGAPPGSSGSSSGMAFQFRPTLQRFGGSPSAVEGSWPRFRGVDFDNISKEDVPLLDHWEPGGPPRLWAVDLGEGHAGPAVDSGRVYLLDYDEEAKADALRCFSLDDGGEIWRQSYPVSIKKNHGISRTVPAVGGGYVVTIGPKCHVLCVTDDEGVFRWGMDLVGRFGTEVPLWYTGQCPIIDGETAVLAPGGSALLAGVDCAGGEIVWETPNPNGWQMSHSSIMIMEFGGRRAYVYAALGGIVAVSAEEGSLGEVLWETSEYAPSVVAPSPVVLDGGGLFVTAGYGAGSGLFRVEETPRGLDARLVSLPSVKEFACEQQTPLFFQGHLFSVMPADSGSLRKQLVCWRPDGTLAWSTGKERRFGLGPFLMADGKLFVLDDDGILTLADASIRSYAERARARVLDGRDAWAPMALVQGRLLLRDSTQMVCLDLRRERS